MKMRLTVPPPLAALLPAAALLLAAALLAAFTLAERQRFVTADDQPQVVRFTAQETTGSVDGTFETVRGSVAFDPQNPEDSFSGRFTVNMASFDTGIGLRDRTMKSDYLDTDQYPTARFVMDAAQPRGVARRADGTLRFSAEGQLRLHGTERTESVQAVLRPRADGAGYSAEVSFDVLLSDYGIERPSWLFLKVEDRVQLTAILALVPHA